jgi:hypothetical protein
VEFTVAERKLPPITGFALRIDSSLGEGAAVPADEADSIAAEAVAASQEERCSTVEIALRLLPRLRELAAALRPGQVARPALPEKIIWPAWRCWAQLWVLVRLTCMHAGSLEETG